jgi:hypothetical protein
MWYDWYFGFTENNLVGGGGVGSGHLYKTRLDMNW